LQLSDLGSGHITYRCVALIDLYLLTNIIRSNRKHFLWTDVCTDDRFIRLTQRSQPKKKYYNFLLTNQLNWATLKLKSTTSMHCSLLLKS